jgi:hypothetical protein
MYRVSGTVHCMCPLAYCHTLFNTIVSPSVIRDKVTISAFILSGSNLKGTLSLEGPIPGLVEASASTGDIYKLSRQLANHGAPLTYIQVVDWENVLLVEEALLESEDEEDEDEPELDDDERDETLDETARAAFEAKRAKKLQDARTDRKRRDRERAQRRRARMMEFQKRQEAFAKTEGEPVQYTTAVPVSGWYQACLEPYDEEVGLS